MKALSPLSGIAMVSRIRVEVRGDSMEAAEEVCALLLDHARMAGFLEGITPQSGNFSDHFFNYPQMLGEPTDPADPWSELGLRYYGRMAFTFEPMSQIGGIQQHGFEVTEIEDFTPHGLHGHPGSESEPIRSDVSENVIVLHRRRAITRFDENSMYVEGHGPFPAEHATTEEILDNIGRLVNVSGVTVSLSTGPDLERIFIVRANLTDRVPGTVEHADADLREAALQVYGLCGTEVTHFDTSGGHTHG